MGNQESLSGATLAPVVLERIARLCKFCLRQRAITPAMLVPALLRAMGGD